MAIIRPAKGISLPDNPLADACIRFLRGYGVDTSFIARQGERLGVYFLEAGANQRASNVVYDRVAGNAARAVERGPTARVFRQDVGQ